MSSKDSDPREIAAADYVRDHHGANDWSITDMLYSIDRAKDREIARLRKLLDDAGIAR